MNTKKLILALGLAIISTNLTIAGEFSEDQYLSSVVTDNSDQTLDQQIQAAITSAERLEADLLAIINATDVLSNYNFSTPIKDFLSTVLNDEQTNLVAVGKAKINLSARLTEFQDLIAS